MEILNPTQISETKLKHSGAKSMESSPAYAMYKAMSKLRKGYGLLIQDSEWPLKNMPSSGSLPEAVRRGNKKYTTRRLQTDKGFVVTRVA